MFKVPQGLPHNPDMEGKEVFEILMIQVVEFMKSHLWLCLGALLLIHWSISRALKNQPNLLLEHESEPLRISEVS
jgi:hypothetical protein